MATSYCLLSVHYTNSPFYFSFLYNRKQAKAKAKAAKKEKQLYMQVAQRQRQNAILTRIREEKPGATEDDEKEVKKISITTPFIE